MLASQPVAFQPIATAAFPSPPSNALTILWTDYCTRNPAVTECQLASPSASPTLPPPSPSATPTSAPTPAPTPTAAPTPTPVPTAAPTPTATPTPTSTAPPATGGFLIIGASQLAALPVSGTAWTSLKGLADGSWPAPDLCNQDTKHGVYVFAAALVYARTGITTYRDKAIGGIGAARVTQRTCGSNGALSFGRQGGSYALAADLIGYRDPSFMTWIGSMRTLNLGGHPRWYTLRGTADDSNNNWGGWARATLAAIDLYLGDNVGIAHDVALAKGFLGDRAAYHVFRGQNGTALYTSEATWACQSYSSSTFVPLNGACDSQRNGAIAGDAYRYDVSCCTPSGTGLSYTTETLSGLAVNLELLRRAGTDLWPYLTAPRRAGDWLARNAGWNYSSISYGNAHLFNARLGTSYPEKSPTAGRMIAGYDWLWP